MRTLKGKAAFYDKSNCRGIKNKADTKNIIFGIEGNIFDVFKNYLIPNGITKIKYLIKATSYRDITERNCLSYKNNFACYCLKQIINRIPKRKLLRREFISIYLSKGIRRRYVNNTEI